MTETKRISTTIKKVWMDKILSGEKTCEYKGATEHWKKRLDPLKWPYKGPITITFLCGQQSYKYRVKRISYYKFEAKGFERDIDGTKYSEYYQIELGERIE